ncbi:MAG TPA: ABC transporter ATP-binding protein [Nitrososphaerales archaeon]|nr:ABC transporter ATP-binding protein [Nitrososphaerales archaeon]
MLTVHNISSGYGKFRIITDVSIEARQKEITVIVGPNGSGKSTLLKTIAGLTSLYSGEISVDGSKISNLPAHEIAKRGLAYLPQTESVFTQLTVAENFKMAGYTVAETEFDSRVRMAMNMFPQLANYLGSKVQNLSGGERQMVAMTMALIRNPKVIMLDEPTANLSPKLANEVLKTVESLAFDLGMAVLLVEQNARKALAIGNRAYLLVGGKKVFDGTAQELLAHEQLASMYLGLKTRA